MNMKIEYESQLELNLLWPVIPRQHCPASRGTHGPAFLSYGDT